MAAVNTTTRALIHQKILDRNARETDPFRAIFESYNQLAKQVDSLQQKLDLSQKEVSRLEQTRGEDGSSHHGKASTTTTALKNEARLRDKLEKLQDESVQEKSEALKTAKRVAELQDQTAAQESLITELKQEVERSQRVIHHLQAEVEDSKSRTKLAEKQYDGLKLTIRGLQEENDAIKKENRQLESRLVSDKGKLVEEMNALTEMVESLKRENEMLKSYNKQDNNAQETKRSSGWFGASFSGSQKEKKNSKSVEEAVDDQTPKFGTMGVVLPSIPKHTVAAHTMEGVCIRYDGSGNDLVATASSDSTVKVWDTSTGTIRSTLHGSSGHAMMGCDIYGTTVIGASSDKTCRVWNMRTERMIHHLVGHQHKVTCVRLCSNGEAVVTGSADRSLKVWDIRRQTYRQTTTLRHGSTPHSVDVGIDSFSAVSGHMDGGLRFWDLRSGDRTTDIADMHEGGITSVQFSPVSSTQLLTNGLDSCLKLVDIRTGTAIHTFRHRDFSTLQSSATARLSPDGKYVAAGSASNGSIFIWNAVDGTFKANLPGHEAGVSALDWGRGTQQVATLDRRGKMILWA